MQYYRCRTPDGAVLWQEITDDGASMTRLIDAAGRVPTAVALTYEIISTDQTLWSVELLPAYKTRKREALDAAYARAVVRDYTSAALGAPHTYPADLVGKLYMNGRVSQAMAVLTTALLWQASLSVKPGQHARPTVENNWSYLAVSTGLGVTGSTEPVWPTVKDALVVDGTVTWRAWQLWTGQFLCKDSGQPVRRNHTLQQIIQVGMEGAAFVQDQLDRRDAIAAQIDAAMDIASLDSISLDFP